VNTVQDADLNRQRELVDAFLAAWRAGNFEALLAVLDPNIVLRDDREAVSAGALKEIRGAHAVEKQVSGRAHAARPALVNGVPGIVVAPRGELIFVIALMVADGKIAEMK
jgi:RNA polymerase sigma-70 factor (ECF subfamily)